MTEEKRHPQSGDAMSRVWSKMTHQQAEALLADVYALTGTAKTLSSERDDTFHVTGDDGREFTLKVANPAEDPASLSFQDGALLHLEHTAPAVPVPRLVPTRENRPSHTLHGSEGPRIVRLLTFLKGDLQYRTPPTATQSGNVGRALAELGAGLQSYQGRPPAGKLMWDISHTLDLAAFSGYVAAERRNRVEAVLEEFARAAPRFADIERRQIIHNDFNPHNILIDPAAPEQVAGIIDFGDMVYAPQINDLAVGLSYNLATDNWAARAAAFLEGFQSVRPLTGLETELLPMLTRARLAMSVIIAEWRSAQFPENRDYIMRNHDSAWRGLQHISDLTTDGLEWLVHNT